MSYTDIQVSSLAAGFSIGFGLLTVWEAIKQTRRNRNPLRSVYVRSNLPNQPVKEVQMYEDTNIWNRSYTWYGVKFLRI